MPSDIHLFLFWYLFLCSKEKSTSTIFFLYNTAYSIVATFVTPLISVIRYICIIFKVKNGASGASLPGAIFCFKLTSVVCRIWIRT